MIKSIYPTPDDIERVYNQARTTYRQQHVGHVYILGSSLGFYKIGLTTNLQQRFSNFGVKLPFDVWLEDCHIYYDCRYAEAYWHIYFGHLRVNGEWFKLDQRDLDTFHNTPDDMRTDFKLQVLYENDDWIPWNVEVMSKVLSDFAAFTQTKKIALAEYYHGHFSRGPLETQHDIRQYALKHPEQYGPDEFNQPLNWKPDDDTPEAEG